MSGTERVDEILKLIDDALAAVENDPARCRDSDEPREFSRRPYTELGAWGPFGRRAALGWTTP